MEVIPRPTFEKNVDFIDNFKHDKARLCKHVNGPLQKFGLQSAAVIKRKSVSMNDLQTNTDTGGSLRYASSVGDSFNLSDGEEPSLREPIGRGAYSTVYKYQKRSKGPIYAEKVFNMNEEEGAPGTAIREISLLRELHHPNVISLRKVRYDPGQMTLLLEYVRYDLRTYIEKFKLPWDQPHVQSLTYQLFVGLKYIHGNEIIHRDLKPENLLITNNGVLKIADFGMARQICHPVSALETRVVTLWYKSPEILLGIKDYGKEIDVWSAGCIVYEMMEGRPLFCGGNLDSQLKTIFEVIGVPSQPYWKELFSIKNFQKIQKIFQQNSPSISQENSEFHNIKSPLMQLFKRSIHKHWLNRPDVFDFLEKCLQPCGSKRITVKQALEDAPFLRCPEPFRTPAVPLRTRKNREQVPLEEKSDQSNVHEDVETCSRRCKSHFHLNNSPTHADNVVRKSGIPCLLESRFHRRNCPTLSAFDCIYSTGA